ncbi:MAG TPA: right-handed parallel beta-helix repeat-containing protein, partial [Chitinophagaceae bacterium]
MRKIYFAFICKLSLFIASLLVQKVTEAQTTVATPYTGSFTSFAAPANIAFVAQNTNAGDIILTGVSQYCQTTENNSVWELYYSSTSLSGVGTPVPGADWTLIATSAPVPVVATGVVPVFTALNFTIPAGAQYRFVMKNTGPGSTRYILTPSPAVNTAAGGGVNLFLGDYQIAGANVGYSGQNTALGTTPRYWHGSITFIAAAPCTTPPNPGSATATPAAVCTGANVQLNLTGNSSGTGQTYVWQSSPSSGGTYADISSSSGASAFTVNPTATTWYRAAVTCGGNTQYSQPIEVVVNPAFPGGTYTINSGAATGGTNFQTFADAVAALSCGIAGPVIFNVQAGSGPYNEQITIPVIGGSSAVNTITFNGNGATIQATPVTATRHIIKLDGADYITFNNLNIVAQAGSTFGWGVHLANGADWNTINGCTIDISAVTSTTQSNSACIVGTNSTTSVTAAGDANNNTISNNTITGAYQGIIINGTATGTLAVNNTITNNTVHDFYANGIELTQNDGSVISYNNIHRTNRAAVTTFAGIELGAGNRNVTVNANRIHDTHTSASTQTGTAYGVYANACDAPAGSENRIINNLIYKFNSGSGTIYGLYNSSSDGFYYYHNTVVLDNASSTAGITRGFYQTTSAVNLQVKNNIIHIARGGTGIKYCLYFGTTTSTIVSNKNVLYNNAPAGTNGIGSFGTTGYTTLANWQTANGGIYDQQSVSTDPLFLNAPGGDYTPGTASIDNIGDYVGVTTDILNAPRSGTTPDPGAYEFAGVVPCTDPPTPGIVTPSENPVCRGTNFLLSIVGGTIGSGQTYQWQSSPDNSVWTNITGATNNNLTTSQTDNTYYRVVVTCGLSSVPSLSILISTHPCYCNSIPTSSGDTEVFGVSINSVSNTSDCVTPAPGAGSILSRYSNFYPLG